MKTTEYEVILTNGMVNHTYNIPAFNEREAVILAQAEAIKSARGYDFVSVSIKDEPDGFLLVYGEYIPAKIIKSNNGFTEVKLLRKPSL